MIRFYAPDILDTLTLPESDSGHCVRVLRMGTGDTIEVVDGRGGLYRCVIRAPHPKHVAVEVTERLELPKVWPGSITIAVAPTKNMDRMEWLVEKLTEVGVDRIVPLLCHHSERREIKVERLEKIAVSAMKQSLKAVLPQIDPMTPLRDFIASTAGVARRFIAHCVDDGSRHLLARELRPAADTAVLIGPEGDFDPAEIELALGAGWQPVTLGDNRLRTETAALVACDTCHIINQLHC